MRTLGVSIVLLLLTISYCQGAKDIRMPPSIIRGPQSDDGEKYDQFKVDARIELDCVATGSPEPQYEWYRDGSLLNLNADNIQQKTDGTGSIVIVEAYSNDDGYYQCRAENKYGIALSEVLHLERAVLDTGLSTAVKPHHVNEGESLVVQVIPRKSVGPTKYTWSTSRDKESQDSNPVVFDKRVNIDEEGNLYFSYVKPEDEKNGFVYKCNVYNSILDLTAGGSYSTIQVARSSGQDRQPNNLYYTGGGSEVIALKGQNQILKCLFEGKPEVTIRWTRSSSSSLPHHHKVRSSTTELFIEDVQLSDEDTYHCTGSNSQGSRKQDIVIKVEAEPEFEHATHAPSDLNVTVGETVDIKCQAFAIPDATVKWLINGRPFEDAEPGARYSINDDGTILTISDVCKDCANGRSDLQNIQCNASNTHGYAYSGGYMNVLLATQIPEVMEPVGFDLDDHENKNGSLTCNATYDDSTPPTYRWVKEDKDGKEQNIDQIPGELYVQDLKEDGSRLVFNAKGDEEKADELRGTYTCIASNGYSQARAGAVVSNKGSAAPVTAGGFDMWWIFIIIAVILLLLILLLCCCLCCQRNRGEAYPVDEKERKQGLDPEKELADSGFQDYQRPEDEPMKGSRASLTSTIKLDSDEEGSLAEYGDLDTGKFNEDGSFIGQYTTDKKKRPPTESNV